jgi:hypothetical protein
MTFGVPHRGTHRWTLDEEKSRPIVRRAVELGINFFDTANSYSDGTSKEITGRLLRELTRRDEIVVATKVFFPTLPGPNGRGLGRKAIFQAIDDSLRRLGMDYVDLYQIHRWDDRTRIEETLEALHDVVKAETAQGQLSKGVSAGEMGEMLRRPFGTVLLSGALLVAGIAGLAGFWVAWPRTSNTSPLAALFVLMWSCTYVVTAILTWRRSRGAAFAFLAAIGLVVFPASFLFPGGQLFLPSVAGIVLVAFLGYRHLRRAREPAA